VIYIGRVCRNGTRGVIGQNLDTIENTFLPPTNTILALFTAWKLLSAGDLR
jgi:hypothetical protein